MLYELEIEISQSCTAVVNLIIIIISFHYFLPYLFTDCIRYYCLRVYLIKTRTPAGTTTRSIFSHEWDRSPCLGSVAYLDNTMVLKAN